jgi:hypothetical protein
MTEAKPTAADLRAANVAMILREPFKAEEIGKLPRVTCPKCSDKKNRSGVCDEHPRKEKCAVCKAFVSPRHIHIDYVGHADVTSRLLVADPEWNWEPVSADEHGLPVFDTDDEGLPVGLWIRLTVGGVTRLGYGSVPSGQNDAVKVLIGDALRNAAMRFGVALDLWAKGDRTDPAAENATASAGQAQRRPARKTSAEWEKERTSRPRPAAVNDDEGWGDWPTVIDGITSPEDAEKAKSQVNEAVAEGRMNDVKGAAIKRAMTVKGNTAARKGGVS